MTGTLADGVGGALGDASVAARVGTGLSVANIARTTVSTVHARNAEEYSEAFDQQMRTSVGAIASTAAGTLAAEATGVAGVTIALGVGISTYSGAIAATTISFTSLSAAATSIAAVTSAVTAGVSAAATGVVITAVAMPVAGIAAAFFGGRIAMATYDAMSSAGVKETSKRRYIQLIGGFSRYRRKSGI